MLPASFTEEGGRWAVESLLNRKTAFDAVSLGGDLLAMTAINLFRQQDFRYRRCRCCYDDIALARYFHPPLSAPCSSHRGGGEALVSAVLALTRYQRPTHPHLQKQAVVRQSG